MRSFLLQVYSKTIQEWIEFCGVENHYLNYFGDIKTYLWYHAKLFAVLKRVLSFLIHSVVPSLYFWVVFSAE